VDTYKQKLSHLKALFHLACADKEFTKAEAIYIKNVAVRIGIDPEELVHFEPGEPTLELPNREYKIYSMFHRLVIVIMIDNKMSDQERHYCFNLGIKMGLHPNAIGEIIDHVEAKGAMDATPAEIMAIFKKYLS
jgi:hypothetical protein